MKKILVLVYTILIISCSGNEDTVTVDGSCFSTGEKTYKWTMVTTWPKNFPGLGMGP